MDVPTIPACFAETVNTPMTSALRKSVTALNAHFVRNVSATVRISRKNFAHGSISHPMSVTDAKTAVMVRFASVFTEPELPKTNTKLYSVKAVKVSP